MTQVVVQRPGQAVLHRSSLVVRATGEVEAVGRGNLLALCAMGYDGPSYPAIRRAVEQGMPLDAAQGRASMDRLVLEPERSLMRTLSRFPELLRSAADAREPHQVAFYLRDLANDFHGYYATEGMKLLDDDAALRNARLVLCDAVAQVIRNGLALQVEGPAFFTCSNSYRHPCGLFCLFEDSGM